MADGGNFNDKSRLIANQIYDETLSVHDDEEVASTYTPSPRAHQQQNMADDNQRVSHDGGLDSDDEFDHDDLVESGQKPADTGRTRPMASTGSSRGGAKPNVTGRGMEISDDDDDDDDDENQSDSSDEDQHGKGLEGIYNPADYQHLPVAQEVKELFEYITSYAPQAIELDTKLKPFIPDYIPAVGDIDAFLKVNRPDNEPEVLGLLVIDEPIAKQSDPTVLDLQLRAISKQTSAKQVQIRSIEDADRQPKSIQSWVDSISDLHRQKPPQSVHYSKTMPEVEQLMQEWPPEVEELLKTTDLPSADIDCSLKEYIDIICSVLDIPVQKNRVESLHVLFTLYSEFKNSQHFNQLARDNLLSNEFKTGQQMGQNTLEEGETLQF